MGWWWLGLFPMLEEGEVEGQRFTREENLHLFLRKSDIPIIQEVATFLQKKNESPPILSFLSLSPPYFFPQDLAMLFKLPANLRPSSLNPAQCAGITGLCHSTLLKAKATHNQFLPLNLL